MVPSEGRSRFQVQMLRPGHRFGLSMAPHKSSSGRLATLLHVNVCLSVCAHTLPFSLFLSLMGHLLGPFDSLVEPGLGPIILPSSLHQQGHVVAVHIPGTLQGVVPQGISLWDAQGGVPKIPEASIWGCQTLACGPHLSCHWFLGGLRAKSGFYGVFSDCKRTKRRKFCDV